MANVTRLDDGLLKNYSTLKILVPLGLCALSVALRDCGMQGAVLVIKKKSMNIFL